jgi:hypothetical protein
MRRGRRSDRRLRAALAVLAATCLAGSAHAQAVLPQQAPLLELTWTAPAGCPDQAHVAAAVQAFVGPRRPSQRPLTARGTLIASAEAPRYRLALAVGRNGVASERTMTGDDCARLAEAAALILALDIDPAAGSGESEPAVPEGPPPAAPARSAPEIAPRPRVARAGRAPASPPRPLVNVQLGARVVFDHGSLPRPTLGVGGAATVARGPFALDLQVIGYQPQFTLEGPRRGTGGAYVGLLAFSAHGCAGTVRWSVEWLGCLGGEVGRASTRGVNIAQPDAAAGARGAISAMARARLWPKRSVTPVFGLAAVHPLRTSTVTIADFGTVFETPAVVLRYSIGLDVSFL